MSEIFDGEDVFYSAQSLHESQDLPKDQQQRQERDDNKNNSIQSPLASPYFQPPQVEKNSAIRFTSPLASPPQEPQKITEGSSKDSILEELLPSHIPTSAGSATSRGGSVVDQVYGLAFKVLFGVWLAYSLLLYAFGSKGASLTGLWRVTNWFMIVLAVSVFGALTWAKVLALHAEKVVYGMTAAIPTCSALLGFYLLGTGWVGIFLGAGMLALAAASGTVLWTQKDELMISIGVIKTGACFLLERPKVFQMTTQIVFGYAFFVLFWLGACSRLLATSFFFMKVLFVVVLLWTSALFGVVQRFLIANKVKRWILEEDVDDDNGNDDDEQNNCNEVVKRNFDSLCVAAAILAVSRFARLTAKTFHFVSKRAGFGRISYFLDIISESIERSLARFTDYVIYYLALNENSDFWNACAGVGRALADRPSLSFTVDSISQLLLFFATLSVAGLSTVTVYYLNNFQLGFRTAGLLGLVSYLALDLVAAVFTASIDASFLAYLIIPRCREMQSLQSAFSAKLLDT